MKTKKKKKIKFQIYNSIKNPKLLASFMAVIFVLSALHYSADIKRATQRFINTAFAADFSTVISGAGSDPVTITVNSGSYDVNSDLTVPANITLHFERGAVIYIANGATLSISGSIDDCLYKIFDDANTDLTKGVKFANGKTLEVRPEWWGAQSYCNQVCVYSTDSGTLATITNDAIEKAINSHRDNITTVVFGTGEYIINRTIKLVGSVSLKGQPRTQTQIILQPYAQKNIVEDASPLQNASITDISFGTRSQGDPPSLLYSIYFSHGTSNFTIRDCNLGPIPGWATYIDVGNNVTIENNFFWNGYSGNLKLHSITNSHIIYNEMASGESILADNCSNDEIRGNIIFNDGGGGGRSAIKIVNSHDLTVMTNRLGPYDYGLTIQDSKNITVKDSIIGLAFIHGIYTSGTVENIVIRDNQITDSGWWRPSGDETVSDSDGIYTTGIFNGGSIENNEIVRWKKGSINFDASPGGGDYPTIQNNEGIDMLVDPPILGSTSTPSVITSSRWKTENTSPVVISDFAKAPVGKEILVEFDDSNTAINFSSSPHLAGNGGVNWNPSRGDHMWCKNLGSYWSCNCFDNTP